jgi:hypothetical protein
MRLWKARVRISRSEEGSAESGAVERSMRERRRRAAVDLPLAGVPGG